MFISGCPLFFLNKTGLHIAELVRFLKLTKGHSFLVLNYCYKCISIVVNIVISVVVNVISVVLNEVIS